MTPTLGQKSHCNLLLGHPLNYCIVIMKHELYLVPQSETSQIQCWNKYLFWDKSIIICLMKIERIKYQILFAHQENIQILFKYLKIFEYIRIYLQKNVRFQNPKFLYIPKTPFNQKEFSACWLSLIKTTDLLLAHRILSKFCLCF